MFKILSLFLFIFLTGCTSHKSHSEITLTYHEITVTDLSKGSKVKGVVTRQENNGYGDAMIKLQDNFTVRSANVNFVGNTIEIDWQTETNY